MNSEIEFATLVFEFLEDDFHFEYHLKSLKESPSTMSVITYYRDNTTIKLSINHRDNCFNLNLIREKDNSFTITSFLDKHLYNSSNNSQVEFETAKGKLMDYIDLSTY